MKRLLVALTLGVLSICLLAGAAAFAEEDRLPGTTAYPVEDTARTAQATPAWLEPMGLNIVDLVGFVPEEALEGVTVSYTPGYGILRYESGSRVGNNVVVTTTAYPRYIIDGAWYGSLFGCLGQPARIDQWGSVAPATTVRFYDEALEITSQVDQYTYVPAGLNLPILNPAQSQSQNRYRYYETGLQASTFTADGALVLPANQGCELIMSWQNYSQITAVFSANVQPDVSVSHLGSQTFTFHSYLGVGYAGLMDNLRSQLANAGFGGRHEKFELSIPEGADYFLLSFPPSPVDPYTQFPGNPTGNVDRPTGGTYRIDTIGALSVDHVNSMGLPLFGHWIDMDISGGTYLAHEKWPTHLAAPEYFVPAGVSYDPCMLAQTPNCSYSVLSNVYNTAMTMTIHYLRVERETCVPDRVPLRMVGPSYNPRSGLAVPDVLENMSSVCSEPYPVLSRLTAADGMTWFIHLPAANRKYCFKIPPDDPTGCPCGYFTEDGRMMDFIPRP
jgi:hypothetical protein